MGLGTCMQATAASLGGSPSAWWVCRTRITGKRDNKSGLVEGLLCLEVSLGAEGEWEE